MTVPIIPDPDIPEFDIPDLDIPDLGAWHIETEGWHAGTIVNGFVNIDGIGAVRFIPKGL
jgi:hypothetical protein